MKRRLKFNFSMIKKKNINPEAVYVAFPFEIENGKLSYEAQGGVS